MNWKTTVLKTLLWTVVCGAATVAPTDLKRVDVVTGSGYFPVLIRLHSGELMAVLRGGASHVGVKGRLEIVSSRDNGVTWSGPKTVVDSPDDDRNPAFGQLKDGTILLAYAIARGYDESGLQFRSRDRASRIFEGVYLVRSRDGGRTWSEPERSDGIYSFYQGAGQISPFGKLIQLGDGTVLMSVYFEFPDERGNRDYIFRSHDNGKTWGDPELVGKGYNETAILDLGGAKILAAMRSQQGGYLATSISSDAGKTWSPPVQVTGEKEHPADLVHLRDGRLLLAYGERSGPFGVHALLSGDGGKSWDKEHRLELAGGLANIDCGYPSSVQLPDGRVVTMYYQVDDAKNTPASAKARVAIWSLPHLSGKIRKE